jgi:Chaperone of endosialidase
LVFQHGSIDVFTTNVTEVIIDINGYYAESLSLAPGTAGAPAVTFGTDATTGIYSASTGTVNIATGGINRLTIRPDGDVDLTGNIRKNGDPFIHSDIVGINLGVGLDTLTEATGGPNTAIGTSALQSTTSGGGNTAVGSAALYFNTTGSFNTAVGAGALSGNTTGAENAAFGLNALDHATTGSSNTALGNFALRVSNGNNNIGIGDNAGNNAFGGGSNNIILGNLGVSGDTRTIRIGAATDSVVVPPFGATQTRTFIAGIRGVTTGSSDAVPVVIDSNGQLGTISSSRRFKEDIRDMGQSTDGLLQLRPVTFHYKATYADGTKPSEYGLIAEEVAEVYPDLVVKGADGEIETVQYQKLTPMLLNELQKLRKDYEADHKGLGAALEMLEVLQDEIRSLKAALVEKAESKSATMSEVRHR